MGHLYPFENDQRARLRLRGGGLRRVRVPPVEHFLRDALAAPRGLADLQVAKSCHRCFVRCSAIVWQVFGRCWLVFGCISTDFYT